MPAELQTRLLRVLSDGHFYRVGGQQPIRANVRVIAATHQDLEERVRQGLFREDLFHRLNVIRLRLPPLRERREDIPLLVRHFLQKSAQELGVERKRISDATLEYLQTQPFPGNVRQLENLCHWLTVMAPAQVVEVADLPPEMRDQPGRESPTSWIEGLSTEADRLIAASPGEVFDRLTREFERTLIRRALAATGGRRIEAAQLLGIGRNTISRKIQDLGMDEGRGGDGDGALSEAHSKPAAEARCGARSRRSGSRIMPFSTRPPVPARAAATIARSCCPAPVARRDARGRARRRARSAGQGLRASTG